MKYLIVGLGNIGPEYVGTRHNIGFMVIKHMLARFEATAEPSRYGSTALVKHKGRQLHLLMPSTYMNLSGKAIKYHLEKQKLSTDNLMVITDDLALPFGKLRMRGKGSDGGHNGLRNIQDLLRTTAYPRLKFGIGSDFPKGRQVDYVLEPFSMDEEIELPKLLDKAVEMVLSFSSIGLARTMSSHNNK